MASVRDHLESIQYDGTNGAVIAALITNGEVSTDTGTFLMVIDGGSDYSINLNDYVVLRELSNGPLGSYRKPMFIGNPTDYAARFTEL